MDTVQLTQEQVKLLFTVGAVTQRRSRASELRREGEK